MGKTYKPSRRTLFKFSFAVMMAGLLVSAGLDLSRWLAEGAPPATSPLVFAVELAVTVVLVFVVDLDSYTLQITPGAIRGMNGFQRGYEMPFQELHFEKTFQNKAQGGIFKASRIYNLNDEVIAFPEWMFNREAVDEIWETLKIQQQVIRDQGLTGECTIFRPSPRRIWKYIALFLLPCGSCFLGLIWVTNVLNLAGGQKRLDLTWFAAMLFMGWAFFVLKKFLFEKGRQIKFATSPAGSRVFSDAGELFPLDALDRKNTYRQNVQGGVYPVSRLVGLNEKEIRFFEWMYEPAQVAHIWQRLGINSKEAVSPAPSPLKKTQFFKKASAFWPIMLLGFLGLVRILVENLYPGYGAGLDMLPYLMVLYAMGTLIPLYWMHRMGMDLE